jgi:hypothetical protein
MTLEAGMIVHSDAVLQYHDGKCSKCKEPTEAILIGNVAYRRWYVAERLSTQVWQIHPHQVNQ